MKKQDQAREIIKLWMERYPAPEERTRNNVFGFFGWLQQNRRELVPFVRHGDPYQGVMLI
jgi:hypothetical protein